MHLRKRSYAIMFATLVTVLHFASLAWAVPHPNAQVKEVHSDPDAVEALQKAYSTVFALKEIKADVNFIIQDESFLRGFFDGSDGLSQTGIQGLFYYTSKHGGNILLRRETTRYNDFKLGKEVAYTGLREVKQKENSDVLVVGMAVGAPEKAGAIDSSVNENNDDTAESPSDTGDESLNVADAKLAFERVVSQLTPTHTSTTRSFPLYYVMPYLIENEMHGRIFTIEDRHAKVGMQECWRIKAVSHRLPNVVTYLWLDEQHNRVLQVQTRDLRTNTVTTATYLGFYPSEKETGFSLYQRVEVTVNGFPLFMAELSEPQINPKKTVVEDPSTDTSKSTVKTPSAIINDQVVPFLSQRKLTVVIILVVCLVGFGIRYAMFSLKRQEFSDEIMVIDEEKGRFSEILTKLGYKIVPFSVEAISKERELLGKGATADTTSRPHSIIVAPHSFNEVRNHSFLIRAYVEEGGRVLVMNHPKKMASSFPYSADMVPVPNVGVTIRHNRTILAGLDDEALRRLTSLYNTTEAYLKIEGKAFNKPIVSMMNKLTGIVATSVGCIRHRKGEYIVCQMQISNSGLQKDRNLQMFFNDLVRYLIGLEPLPYENNK